MLHKHYTLELRGQQIIQDFETLFIAFLFRKIPKPYVGSPIKKVGNKNHGKNILVTKNID